MFIIEKTMTIAAAHRLSLPYESPCTRTHGHNYKIKVTLTGKLNSHGMVCDFAAVGEQIKHFDHTHLNDFFNPPTAEIFAQVLAKRINEVLETLKVSAKCVKVEVSETAGTMAIWYDETYAGPAF